MKKLTASMAILFLLAVVPLNAQQPVLKGNISDTAAKQNLEQVLITLLRVEDPTRYKFYRTDATGNFEIKNLMPGKYKLATPIMMDLVFAVSFFTQQIFCITGPEGFNGVSGMILSLIIPHLYATCYTSKRELIEIKGTDIAASENEKMSAVTEQCGSSLSKLTVYITPAFFSAVLSNLYTVYNSCIWLKGETNNPLLFNRLRVNYLIGLQGNIFYKPSFRPVKQLITIA